MGRPSKITPEIAKRIRELRVEGGTTRGTPYILEKLTAEGVKVSRTSIHRFLKRESQARAEVTKEVLRERLHDTVTVDVDVLGELQEIGLKAVRRIARCLEEQEQDKLPEEGDIKSLARIMGETRQVAAHRLKLAGAEEPDEPGVQEDMDAMVKALFRETYNTGSAEDDAEDEG